MSREELAAALVAEVDRWSAKPYAQLAGELRDEVNYTIGHPGGECQVEVLLLENCEDYLHVLVSIDDGSFWRSVSPLSHSFLVYRSGRIAK